MTKVITYTQLEKFFTHLELEAYKKKFPDTLDLEKNYQFFIDNARFIGASIDFFISNLIPTEKSNEFFNFIKAMSYVSKPPFYDERYKLLAKFFCDVYDSDKDYFAKKFL